MVVVTIPKKEYAALLDAKLRYEYMRHILDADPFSPPPTRSRREILKEFRAAKIYTAPFLKGLERGLKRSTYFRV